MDCNSSASIRRSENQMLTSSSHRGMILSPGRHRSSPRVIRFSTLISTQRYQYIGSENMFSDAFRQDYGWNDTFNFHE